tara:strand:+ start:7287 stop:7631 length:345 start_codon:yes stop_codon:yes gene_type:complete
MQNKRKYIILSILTFIIFFLVLTTPKQKDFDTYLSDKVRNYTLNMGEDNQNAAIFSGLTFYILQNNNDLIERENYLLFSIFKIDTSLIRSFGGDIDDIVVLGILGNFFILRGVS